MFTLTFRVIVTSAGCLVTCLGDKVVPIQAQPRRIDRRFFHLKRKYTKTKDNLNDRTAGSDEFTTRFQRISARHKSRNLRAAIHSTQTILITIFYIKPESREPLDTCQNQHKPSCTREHVFGMAYAASGSTT